ncbi:PMT family glycosyltransferase, 4-amino-4-deoxy-L-arabinose transferase [Pseudomonas asplenii]|uniref:PMT family glycosyltransferase, 4-amino-4-deoxy-L-arabinose transferase n=1 Tax=Pseudomonas asplenii TaxID=53407 RepID=A0A0M9GI60_9PSED|nr:phospholipid carrier-dependent glycosyltransferase [Pseudomonas fuscovaginae]KPA91588.1 PMT family glycosyltransferase, 4-amino-4-deoxy-L-arabinose transferase [Pseudomonas fuscovaginae]
MRTTRPVILLFLLGCLLFFFALGNHELQGSTESRVAGIAMEMHLNNDWITPRLLGDPFLEKPPLSLWLDATAIKLLGGTPLAVRLASAFAGLFTVLALYGFMRRIGRPTLLAWAAAAMLMTMASYLGNARQVGEDAILSLGVSLALFAFFQANEQRKRQAATLGSWLVFMLGIAIATLTKGVLGLALPGVVIFFYLVSESLLERRLTLGNWLRPALFTLVGLIPLLIWLKLLYGQGGADAVREVLWANSVGRFSGSFTAAGHYEPFYYYFTKLPEAFLPWNLLVYLGLWHLRKELVRKRHLLFASVWFLAQFTLLTLASSKRMVYMVSMAPAAAIIAAEYSAVVLAWLRRRSATSTLSRQLVDKRRPLAAALLAVVVCGYLVAAWRAPLADRNTSFKPVTDQVIALQASGKQVALYQPDERLASTVFYTQRQQAVVQTQEQLDAFLQASPDNVAVAQNQQPDASHKVLATVTIGGKRTYYFYTR